MGILSIFNVIIALAAIFFFCSAIASHINELFAGYRNARGKRLHAYLADSLGKEIAGNIYNHVLIRTISNRSGMVGGSKVQFPNYIDKTMFGRVVQNLYGADVGGTAQNELFVLLNQEAGAEGVKLAQKVEEWFDLATRSLSGRYTRTTTFALFVIGLGLAAVFDIDTVNIAKSLTANSEATAEIVEELQGIEFAAQSNPSEEEIKQALDAISKLQATPGVEALYGWQTMPASYWDWGKKGLGWLLTALAISLGAQFWFRILSESLRLRQTQEKPDEASEADSTAPSKSEITTTTPRTPAESGEDAPTEAPQTPAESGEDAPPGSKSEAPVHLASTTVEAPRAPELGKLSKKYEVGNRGPETVSTGKGDPGGVSYGSYQMASKKSQTVKHFVKDSPYEGLTKLKTLSPGSKEFSAEWEAIAKKDPDGFQEAQHDYIKATHFDPAAKSIKDKSGLDITARSNALQNVLWSTAVQHGADGAQAIVAKAMGAVKTVKPENGQSYDKALIEAVYAERGRKKKDGSLAYFSSSGDAVKAGVAKRFKNELADALNMLEAEETVET